MAIAGVMKKVRSTIVAVLAVMLSSCTAHYTPLGYIEFQNIAVMKVKRLRSDIALFLKNKCHLKESHQDRPERSKFTKHFSFHDVYDCHDNIYTFVNQRSVTISYQLGKAIGSQKWQVLGQGIEVVVQKTAPNLKMVWPKIGMQ